MSDKELTALQESNRNYAKRFASDDARRVAEAKLKPIRIEEASKAAIVERLCVNPPLTEANLFDTVAFDKLIEAELEYASRFLPAGAQVKGVGAAAVAADPKVLEAQRLQESKDREFNLNRSARQFNIRSEEAQRVFREGRRAFDPTYCAPTHGARKEA